MDKSGIRHIHGQVAVLFHEALHPRDVSLVEVKQPDHAGLQNLPQGFCACQEVDRRYMASTKAGQTLTRGT